MKSLLRFVDWRLLHLRANDLFGRIGGEEFASLLPNTTRKTLFGWPNGSAPPSNRSHLVGDHTIRATVSVGVALSNDATADLAGLLNAADQALYRAKEAGRNRVEIRPMQRTRSAQTAGRAINS